MIVSEGKRKGETKRPVKWHSRSTLTSYYVLAPEFTVVKEPTPESCLLTSTFAVARVLPFPKINKCNKITFGFESGSHYVDLAGL